VVGKLKIYALGRPQLKEDNQPLTDLVPAKALALLVYLAVSRQPHSRSALANLLWGDMPEETARANLRLTLSKLRKEASEHLIVTRQSLAFDFDQPHWIDVADFEKYALDPKDAAITDLRDAVNLYRGDFLHDFQVNDAPDFESWVIGERERHRETAIKALSHLSEHKEQDGELAEAITVARRILSFEPWHEEAHRQLMRLLAQDGQRSAALAQYGSCRSMLAEELGVEPSPATTSLYEQIKTNEIDSIGEVISASYDQTVASAPELSQSGVLNLPVYLTSLVGRNAELIQVSDMLTNPDCRLLTLVGPGGIGKTRLAVATAEEQNGAFRDGATFVSLVGAIPAGADEGVDLLVYSIANAIGYTFSAQLPPRDLLLNHLRDQERLIVLDNFEHLIRATKLVDDILRFAPGIKLLVTSRERLSLESEWVFDVAGLTFEATARRDGELEYPARDLFVQRAIRIKHDLNPSNDEAAIHRICELVEGSPLGIELSANWVRTIPCAEIANRLEGNLDLLSTASTMVAERHQSMRVVLDNSWILLIDDEQRAFRGLSVFQGGFSLEAATEVLDVSLPVLARLVDKALLRRDESGRYRMHELIRQYVADQLAKDATEELRTRDRHSQYYAEFLLNRKAALQYRTDRLAIAELDVEVKNLRAAWEWLLKHAKVDAIADYLEGLWLFQSYNGWFPEAVIALEQASQLSDTSVLQRARWQRLLGEAHYQMGHTEQSRKHSELSLNLLGMSIPSTQGGWVFYLTRQLIRQLFHRAWPAKWIGRPSEKEDYILEGVTASLQLARTYYFSESKLQFLAVSIYTLNLAERAGNYPEMVTGYATLAMINGTAGLQGFARFYERLTKMALRDVNNPSSKAAAGELIGIYKTGIGRWPEATESLEQAVKLFEHVRLPRMQEESTALLALTEYYQGSFDQSTMLWSEALKSARYRGDPVTQAWCLMGLAENVLRRGGDTENLALDLLKDAHDLPDALFLSAEFVRLNGLLARAHLYADEQNLALGAAQSTAECIQQSSIVPFYAIEGYTGAAEVCLKLWENGYLQADEGSKTASRAVKNMRSFARLFPIGQPRSWLYQGLYHWLDRKPAKAQKAWQKSLEHAKKLSMPYDQALAHFEIGRHITGQPARANDNKRQAHLTQARDIFSELNAASNLASVEAALAVMSTL